MSYLNPIKMYVFISAFFFLFFFSVINPGFNKENAKEKENSLVAVRENIKTEIGQMEEEVHETDKSPVAKKILQANIQLLRQDLLTIQSDSIHLEELNYFKFRERILGRSDLSDVHQYDSLQSVLGADEKDSWLNRTIGRKFLEMKVKYKNENEFFEKLFEKFRHTFPQLLFVSLPLFALLLKLLYVRTKSLFYVDHVIFSVHLYCATFVLMFVYACFSHYDDTRYLTWLGYLTTPVLIYLIWYQYKSLKNFYRQSRSKTILKYFLLLIMSSIVMSMLFLIFLVFSVFNM